MMHSMTGFSRKELDTPSGIISVELRSINQRYLETNFRLLDGFRQLEPIFREILNKKIKRGKIEIHLKYTNQSNASPCLIFNKNLAKQIMDIHKEISTLIQRDQSISTSEIMRFPNVIVTEEMNFETIKPQMIELFNQAVDDLVKSRQAEGERIEQMIHQRLEKMQVLVNECQTLSQSINAKLRDRLLDKLKELSSIEIDPNRLEQEIVIQLQRLDVTEEIDRLFSHITEMYNIFKRNEPVGRRLDFLTQELNREANTLGSKAQEVNLTNIAIELKVLIEQIREQIQNIE